MSTRLAATLLADRAPCFAICACPALVIKRDCSYISIHFSLEAIGKLISAISSEKWIEIYEQSRLMTKAGQAQMTKQDAPSASKVAAKRVDTKRRLSRD